MSDHLTEDWPLSHSSSVYMDGTATYLVRRYGKPGVLAYPKLSAQEAQAIRKVVSERIKDLEDGRAFESRARAGLAEESALSAMLTYFRHLVPEGSRVRCAHPGGGYSFGHTTSAVWMIGHTPSVMLDGHPQPEPLLNITVINNGEMRE